MSGGDWKDHPVIILGGAFGAGVAFALTVAIPIYNTSAQNTYDAKLQQIEDKYAHDKADIANTQSLRRDNLFWRRQLSQARAEVWQLSDNKPFRSSSALPVGLEAIVPGLSLVDVKVLLPKAKFSSNVAGYVFVEFPSGFIRQLQLKIKGDRVKTVTYYVSDDAESGEKLLAAATLAFGSPDRKDFNDDGIPLFHWKVAGREATVFGKQYSVD